MAQTTSVLWSVDQGLGEDAKAQARKNIGAVGVEKSDGSIPPTISTVNKMTINTSNKSVTCDNQGIGLLIPEPRTGEQNYVLRAGYAGSPGKGWAEWQELETDSLVIVYSGSPQLSETDYQKMVSYVSNHKMVYIMYGVGGTSAYYKLSSVNSSGYNFEHVSDSTKSIMHIDNNRAVTTTTYSSQTKIKHEQHYQAGNSGANTILVAFKAPEQDGKYPSRIDGSFTCKPTSSSYTSLSVLPFESYSRIMRYSPYSQETPTSYPDIPGSNCYVYPYTEPGDYADGETRCNNYSDLTVNKLNTINFNLVKKNSGDNKELKYIAIKGKSSGDSSNPFWNYNIKNLKLTYYYD